MAYALRTLIEARASEQRAREIHRNHLDTLFPLDSAFATKLCLPNQLGVALAAGLLFHD